VKSASDVLSPVSGKVIEGNAALDDKPKTINESPEDKGWIARIEVNDSTELEDLLDAKAYLDSVGEDDH
jgi:glycine cleavage system H protein